MRQISLLKKFFRVEASSSIVLFVFTLLALIWANSSFHQYYHAIWDFSVAKISLHQWINDGLMSVFFLVVGLEIKQEFVRGELSSRKKASLPLAAALGGMCVPAAIYMLFNQGSDGFGGWGIPTATDIAFVIGVVTLFGSRVPTSLKVFLLALAIVDDLGAVLLIALLYTANFSALYFLAGIAVLGLLVVLNRMKVTRLSVYLSFGFLLWFAFLKSGIHPTIAGVLISFVVPLQTGTRLKHILHPWVSFGIIPLFALANAGVTFTNFAVLNSPVSYGIIAGLFLGKPLGIIIFSFISLRCGLAEFPMNASWRQFLASASLAGIGFTMSLFISNLAFNHKHYMDVATPAILMASILSAIAGSLLFITSPQSKSDIL